MTTKTPKTFVLDPYPMTLRVKATRKPMGETAGHTVLLSNGDIIVTFDINRPTETIHSTVIHEAVHVCQFVQDFVQTKFDIETEAYFIEEVASKMMSVLGIKHSISKKSTQSSK